MTSPELLYVAMPGPEFETLVSRYPEAKTHPLYGLASPRLKYYDHRSCLVRGPDERVLIMCVVPVNADRSLDDEGNRFTAIGMLELEVAPGDAGTVWFKYLTVHPDFQRQGIAKQLLRRMVAVLQDHPRVLQRSRSSDEGARKIQGYIDALLAESDVLWRQTGR
jgi:ribosomal protein S18 acetylase RimI-like enzyme